MNVSDLFWETLLWIKENRRTVLYTSIGITALLTFFLGLFGHVILVSLIIFEIAVALFVGKYDLNPALELVTFIVVFAAFKFGATLAIWLGVFLVFVHYLLAHNLGPHLAYMMPSVALVGWFAGAAFTNNWLNGDFYTIGLLCSILYNAVTAIIGSMLESDIEEELFWGGVNFGLNLLLFWKVGPIVLFLLRA